MALRRGIVVATHPEDHSVDLVMADNGARLTGVQVMTPNGSTRTGTVDMPAVPEKKDKWDVTKPTGQDMIALVDTVGRNPVVTGFLYPQVNQMLSKDPKRLVGRHQSDVSWGIDGEGNIQLNHPSGTYIRIGEAPDREETEAKNADANAKVDRNTGRKVNVRIGLAGNVVVLTMTPDGDVSLEMTKDLNITVGGNATVSVQGETSVTSVGNATVKAPQVMLDALETHCTGNLTVDGALSIGGGGTIGGGSGATLRLLGDLEVEGDTRVSGSVTDGDGDGGA